MYYCPPLPLRLRYPIRLARCDEHVRRKRLYLAVNLALTINMEFVRKVNCAICAVFQTIRAIFLGVDCGEYVVFVVVTADAGDPRFEHVVYLSVGQLHNSLILFQGLSLIF